MFITEKSINGNIGASMESMEKAIEQQKNMDESKCNNCYNCNDCYNCNYCYKCNNCYKCYNCYKCNNCYNCTKCNDCDKQPIQIIGITWIVTIRQNETIKIGCEDHTREFWMNATDDEIAKMEYRALKFWGKYKNLILNFSSPES